MQNKRCNNVFLQTEKRIIDVFYQFLNSKHTKSFTNIKFGNEYVIIKIKPSKFE